MRGTSLLKNPSEVRRELLLAERDRLRRELPHLYGWKWYRWARAFFESRNRMNLLCAANQISKSTTLIRKNLHWATAKNLWPSLWETTPRQFWYLYPTLDVATDEFHLKWVPEVMPKCSDGDLHLTRRKEKLIHPVYGWEAQYDGKDIDSILFTSGVELKFRGYSQSVHNLQTGTVHMISCDEELPETYFDELMFRLAAVDGYFNMVYTATRNQLMWYLAMQGKGDTEKFPEAFKLQISMDDCKVYEDGTPGHYSEEKIKIITKNCKNKEEVARRVHGKHPKEGGLKYGAFSPDRHIVAPFPIPSDYKIYGGIDIGGGGNGHPSALGFIAVAPDNSKGYVFKGKRYDDELTTAGDMFVKFIEMRGSMRLTAQVADAAAKDFHTIADRSGDSFLKGERSHAIGEQIINTLFSNNMLFIFDIPDLRPLATELMTLKAATAKQVAKDDFIDGAIRYPAVMIPWDFSSISATELEKQERARKPVDKSPDEIQREIDAENMRLRRGESRITHPGEAGWLDDIQDVVREWNEHYG